MFDAEEGARAGAPRSARYQAIFRSAVDFAIVAMDRDGRVTDWNPGAERIFGWTAEEMLGAPASRFFTPEDRAEDRPGIEMDRALETGRASDERWHVRKGGARFWASGDMHPLWGEDGAHLGFLKIVRDRTEQKQAGERLRASEERFSAALTAARLGSFEWNLLTDAVVLDERSREIFGFAPGEGVHAQEVFARIHPDDFPRVRAEARASADSLSRLRTEYRIRLPDGSLRHVASLSDAAPGADGRAERMFGVFADITERERTEARSRDLLATLDLATVFVRDFDGTILFWSEGCERLYGWQSREVLGHVIYDLLDVAPPVPLAEIDATLLREGEWRGDVVHRRRDGAEITVAVRTVLRRNAHGRALVVVETLSDVTAQRRAEAALAENEARLRVALATTGLGTWETDLRTGRNLWDAQTAVLLGYPPERVAEVWQDWLRVILPADRKRVLQAFYAAARGGTPYVEEFRVRRADGAERIFVSRGVLAGPDRMVGVVQDVTEARAAEAALTRSRAELERLVAERTQDLEATQERLVQAQRMEALGQLAGGIAHDFNNVLQAVQGGAGLIARRPDDPERVVSLARMLLETAGRGAAITRRLLAFSRRGDLRAEPMDAAGLLAGVQEILAHTLGAGIAVQVEAAAGLRPLLADKGQLETVLINLATNARDAMQGSGTLTLAAAAETVEGGTGRGTGLGHPAVLKPGTYVRLSVSDTGTGMDAATLARASEPFFTTKAPGQGTGLGLAMARGFAEQSGGGLFIESAPGLGTTVRLWLPVAAGMAHKAPAAAMQAGAAAPDPAGARVRLLLVDDDAVVREVLGEQLKAAGYAVLSAESAGAALALLEKGPEVDLVVSDLSMPGMDGIALIREAQRRNPRLPAVLLTGFATDATAFAAGGAIAGTFMVLRKPVEGKALAEQVAVLLEGASRSGLAPQTRRTP